MGAYHVHSARSRLVFGIVLLLVGVVPLVASFGGDGDGLGGRSVFGALFGLAFLWGGIAQLREVREIVVEPGGTIEFLLVIGATRIAAREIRGLEGRRQRDYDGDPVWQLRVHHQGRRIHVDSFQNAREFVDQVVELNPAVVVRGEWPMAGFPPDVR